jgi:hypothetical protein
MACSAGSIRSGLPGKGNNLVFLLCRNHLMLIMTLSGLCPRRYGIPRLRLCCNTCTLSWRNFYLGNAEASQCAPAPHGGQGWRKGEIINWEEGSIEQFFQVFVHSTRRFK